MADFTHLHVHSHYSLLDGLGKLSPMLARARAMDMNALALTDHGNMYGTIEFYRAAKDAGIKPILGVEAYLAPYGRTKKRGKIDANPRHLTLLAQNNTGYKNLIQLTSKANLEGYYYKPRIDYELLERYGDGLIVLSGCLNGDISKAIVEKRESDAKKLIEWHIERFSRDNFYLEVQHHANLKEQGIVNEGLFTYAKEYNLHLAATADSHYIHADDGEAHDVLLCVQTGKTVNDTDRMSMLDDDFSLKSADEMKELWSEHPDAIDNTQKIADMCNVDIEFGINRLPPYPLPKGTSADQHLRKECLAGLTARYQTLPEDAQGRLDYELGVIEKTGYASYFLIVADFVNEAKSRGILVGPGRGSAAGSLVSYVLNITNIDPLAYNLLFERFLNPERVSMPDIDLDFADDRRDEIIQYVRDKYGHEHVAQIITFGTMAARAAVRDAGRALGLPYTFCDQVAKAIPMLMNFEDALKTPDLKSRYENDPQVRRLIDTATKLEGVCRHASTHAAGVVITDEPLTEYVPLQLATTGDDDSNTVTQYAMYDVEALGLLKMDFLGLKNLTIIQNTLKLIKQNHGTAVDIDRLPLSDTKAFKLLQSGTTTGVFQLESSGMKRYLKELKPTEFEDIISMVSLYRPGPMDSIPDFIAAKHGQKVISYLHPLLKPILEKTYGVIVTQDQVLQIAREFAGFSYAEADILRKAVGKKIKTLLDEQREKFVKGAMATNKVSQEMARKVWDFIEPFARYGFNRAHATCYAMIAYQTAYLKANYPAEFMAALLTSDEGNIDRAAVEVAEAASMGLEILPPDINESGQHFTVVNGGQGIRFGIGAIKNVGQGVVAALIAERNANGPFSDLTSAFARVDSKDFNRKSVESLARAGAFDQLAERQYILTHIDKLLDFNRTLHKQRDSGQQGLFGDAAIVPPPRLVLAETSPAPKEDRLAWEKELLGMYVSEHPLADFQTDLTQRVTSLADVSQLQADQKITVAGIVTKVNAIITKSNQPMAFAQLEDMAGKSEVVIFPKTYKRTVNLWVDGAALIVMGKTNDKDGETKILVDNVWQLTSANLRKVSPEKTPPGARQAMAPPRPAVISIRLPAHFSKAAITQLQNALRKQAIAGGVPVELLIGTNGTTQRVQTQFAIKSDAASLEEIKQITGNQAVSIK